MRLAGSSGSTTSSINIGGGGTNKSTLESELSTGIESLRNMKGGGIIMSSSSNFLGNGSIVTLSWKTSSAVRFVPVGL